MTEELKTAQDNQAPARNVEPETAAARFPALLAALISIFAWVLLIVSDGYVAMAVAAVGAAVGFYAVRKGWRSLATASIIASLVLIVVTAAFLIVIKYIL